MFTVIAKMTSGAVERWEHISKTVAEAILAKYHNDSAVYRVSVIQIE